MKTRKSVMFTHMLNVTTIDLSGIKKYMIKRYPAHKVSHQSIVHHGYHYDLIQ